MSDFWDEYGKLIGAVVGLVVLFVFLKYAGIQDHFVRWFQQDLRPWLNHNPVLAPFVFIGVYIFSVIILVPGTIMTVVGGALFGPLWGTLYVSAGSILGAALAFLIARYLGADWVDDNLEDKLNTIKQGIEEDGWQFVAVTRLVPLFPFNLLNYAFGLTRINFWVHFWVSALTMLPGTFAYVYAGYAGRELFAGQLGTLEGIIIGASAAGLLLAMGLLSRWVRRL